MPNVIVNPSWYRPMECDAWIITTYQDTRWWHKLFGRVRFVASAEGHKSNCRMGCNLTRTVIGSLRFDSEQEIKEDAEDAVRAYICDYVKANKNHFMEKMAKSKHFEADEVCPN